MGWGVYDEALLARPVAPERLWYHAANDVTAAMASDGRYGQLAVPLTLYLVKDLDLRDDVSRHRDILSVSKTKTGIPSAPPADRAPATRGLHIPTRRGGLAALGPILPVRVVVVRGRRHGGLWR